jgi:hypothetical protein
MAISDNWQKAAPSTRFGTPELAFFAIDAGTDIETNWDQSNSMYAKVVRGIQLTSTLYVLGKPNGNWVTVATNLNTTPFGEGESAGNGGTNSKLKASIDSAAGTNCTVWNAELNGGGLNYD